MSILSRSSTKQVGLYTVTGTLTKVLSFAALPFFVNTLSEADIGILNIFSSTIVFLTPVISLGALYTLSVDYFKVSRQEYSKVFSTSLLIPVIACVLMVPILFGFYPALSRSFHFQPQFFWLIPACLLLNFFFEAFVLLLRLHQKPKLFATISVLKVALEIGVAVLFIIFISKTWLSRATGYLVSAAIVAAVFFYYVLRNHILEAKFNLQVLKRELVFGVSGLLLQSSVFFINYSDKFFVMAFFGKTQAGLYSVAGVFAAIQYIICSSLLQYLQPVLMGRFAKNQRWPQLKFLYKKYILIMAAAWVAVVAATFIIYHLLLKQSYIASLPYFYLLSVSSFVWTISNIFLQHTIYTKHKRNISSIALAGIIISLLVNYLVCKIWMNMATLAAAQIIINAAVLGIVLIINKRTGFFKSSHEANT